MKFNVTSELTLLIKTLRMQNDIPGKELAEKIGKSPSYLSKLEKGDVKMIKEDVLKDILRNTAKGEEFYPDKFEYVIHTLSTISPPEKIYEQRWLLQLDGFDRPVELPEKLAEDIKGRLAALGISYGEFVSIINANKDLYGAEKLPINEVVLVNTGEGNILRMRIRTDEAALSALLDGKDRTTNYVTCYNLVFTLIKLEKYGDAGHMEPEEAREVLAETGACLASYDLYSLTRYGQMLASNEFQTKQLLLLRTFETASTDSVSRIVDIFNDFAEHDRMMAAESIDRMRANLEWDPAFMLNIVGMRFDELGMLSFSNKKKLLGELKSVLEKYDSMSEMEKRLEQY